MKDRVLQVRYRPYNILQTSKKIVKIPLQKTIELQNKSLNFHESTAHIQQLQKDEQTSQQLRDYDTNFKQRIRIKKDLIKTPDNQINTVLSQSSNTNDL